MPHVLIVVDTREDTRKILGELKKRGYTATTSLLTNSKRQLAKRWDAIGICVDSQKRAGKIVASIRQKKSKNKETPIVCVQPSMLSHLHLSIVHSKESMPLTMDSVLSTLFKTKHG